MFHTISNTSTAGSQLTVTLNADNNGNPGDALCTLSDPATFTSSGVQTFSAPGTCPALAPSTAYFAVIGRVLFVATDTITLNATASSNEDIGGAAGWTVEHRLHFFTSSSWESTTSLPHVIEVNGHAVFSQAFNFTLSAAGNQHPTGLWSDGATMWVADFEDSKIYAYNMATKARVEDKEFDTLASSSSQEDDNSNPKGIWSDGATMWVSDENATRVFAYDMTTKARVKAKEFRVPARVVFTQLGSHLETDSRFQDIWSDGNGIMWLVSDAQNSAYAYRIDTGKPVPSENLLVGQPYQQVALGIWGDDQSIWLGDSYQTGGTLHAFWKTFKGAQPGRDIQLDTANNLATGLWSDGATMWVADWEDAKIYAYPIPAVESPLAFRDRLSVERVTDTTAIVALDLRGLPFAGARKSVSISINGGGATIYAHPDAGTARFMLRGLEPETQYTVSGKFDVRPSHNLGGRIFRTDYARLDGVVTSGLTHTEATVTVSLAGADVDHRDYANYWVSRDEGGPERTYYLRHKPSDGSDWSDAVELTFSGSTTDARLTGLDPGTAYDVEVGEDATFTPPSASVPGYAGTLTVADDGTGILGMDVTGFYSDPYGSISPSNFEVGGSEREITALYIHPYGGPDFDLPALYLEFDTAFGGSNTEFTLTIGTTVYNSTDATRVVTGYEWLASSTWSEDDMVAVAIGFTETVPFREGTTLEETGAFTTATLPTPIIIFEAEMTVDAGTSFDGFDIGTSLSPLSPGRTFTVDGVQYTVSTVGYQKTGGLIGFHLEVQPAIPSYFTLTLGATPLQSSSASSHSGFNGGTLYRWAGTTNPNWASGAMVDIELGILIDICDRSQAVADAIVAATTSFDFCHMISPVDMAAITELDLTGKSGYGLKLGDFAGLPNLEVLNMSGYSLGGHNWNQLPAGLFDGLDSLEVLDLSDTNLLNLNRRIFEGLDTLVELDLSDTLLDSTAVPVGVFDGLDSLEILRIANAGYRGRGITFVDEDIFRGLDTLRELDARPIRPSDDVLAPLTSLETLNGQGYTP